MQKFFIVVHVHVFDLKKKTPAKPNQTKTHNCEFKYFKTAKHENHIVFM